MDKVGEVWGSEIRSDAPLSDDDVADLKYAMAEALAGVERWDVRAKFIDVCVFSDGAVLQALPLAEDVEGIDPRILEDPGVFPATVSGRCAECGIFWEQDARRHRDNGCVVPTIDIVMNS